MQISDIDTRKGFANHANQQRGCTSHLQRWQGLEGGIQLGAEGVLHEQVDQVVGDGVWMRAGNDGGIIGVLV